MTAALNTIEPAAADAWGEELLAPLGAGLPAAAEEHLQAAGLAYQDDALAEWHLQRALALAPGHAAVLIGLYRYYFYKNRLNDALAVVRLCLRRAAEGNGLAADWRDVRRDDAAFDSYEAIWPRFYLFSLKGYAYLQMRLGQAAEGREAVSKLLQLDPSDKLGFRVLQGVLDRVGQGDDD